MSKGELSVTGRLVDASNATLYGTIVDGADEVRVIYKPIAGERPLWDFPDGNLAQREYAAFLVSELGGWKTRSSHHSSRRPFRQRNGSAVDRYR